MKKLIIFLITVLSINFFSIFTVNAESFKFYEAEYIDGVYLTREKGGTKYYQKARFFRLADSSNRFAYCIEPFTMFNPNSTYTRSLTADSLNEQQMKRISLISHFGYQYGNHTDPKWYAITQYMIWQTADPSAPIYFTNGLNGARINAYTAEINEIEALINNYTTAPSIANYVGYLVEGQSLTLTDTNNVLSNYVSNNPNAKIVNNTLQMDNLKEGVYDITLTRSSRIHSVIPFFYNSGNSQDLTTVGDLDDISVNLKVIVNKTSIEITKIDKDKQDIIPSGEASLTGAVYQLYNENMEEVDTLTIDKNMKAKLENIPYGKYYLKELVPGIGYQLDDTIYEFNIDKDNLDISLKLENEVIKKKIEINKNYGDGTNSNHEAGISFDILNNKGEVVATITTDENGYASIYLPYGTYTIKQKNSTPGYALNDDFTIDIKDDEDIKYNLYDFKIKVPNTSKQSNVSLFLIIAISGLYVKKKLFS